MGYQNREKEMKFIVEGAISIKEVDDILYEIYKNKNIERVEGNSKDVYWHPVSESSCDFTRVRYPSSSKDLPQLTVKKKDKGYILDRIEIDLDVCNADNAVKLVNMVIGKPAGDITKTYSVLFLNKKEENVSVYKVDGCDHIFLEIEARSSDKVRSFEKQLKKGLENHNFNLKRVYHSLYELIIKNKIKDISKEEQNDKSSSTKE